MATTTLNFSSDNKGGFASEWFQPNKPFQLDIVFGEAADDNVLHIYSANDNTGTEPLALSDEMPIRGKQHVNVPVFDVIPDAGVYYKVATRYNPSSANYATE